MAKVTKSMIEDNAEKIGKTMLFRNAEARKEEEPTPEQTDPAPAADKKTEKRSKSANAQSKTPVVSFKTRREDLDTWNAFMEEHGLRKDAFYRFACNEYVKNHSD